ncbi:MAG: glycine zipper domain-containing protein [Nitrospirota bacterium]
MKKIIVILMLVAFSGFQLTGCATMSETEKGAAVGAVAGGILGAILGDTKGAIIGTLAGAIVGGVIGNYYDKQTASRAEAARKYEYKAHEEQLEIEDVTIRPQEVTTGASVDASVLYTVLTPDERQNVKITEVRTLVNGKEKLELARREIVRTQGTHLSTMKFTMPKDIEKGDYTLITTVSDGKQTRTAKGAMRIV